MLGNATALHDPEKTKQFREQIAELSMAVLEKSICSYISNNLVSYKCFIYIEESKKALSNTMHSYLNGLIFNVVKSSSSMHLMHYAS